MQDKKLDYVVLCKKVVTLENGTEIDTFFSYRQEEKDGEYVDILTPTTDSEGNPVMVSKSIKTYLSEDFKAKLTVLKLNFPLFVTLDREKRVPGKDGKMIPAHTVKEDIDMKTGKPRLDKYGKKHLALTIRDAVSVVEKVRDSHTLDDLDNY